MKQAEFNIQFRSRTKNLALEIIEAVSPLKYSDTVGVLRKQVIRSGTSVAANFRAVCRARSQRERFAKLCIVVEEADEVIFWIEMFEETGLLRKEDTKPLNDQAEEVLKVMSRYKALVKQSLSAKNH